MLANPDSSPESVCENSQTTPLTFYPAGSRKLHEEPIVLIHGWGANSDIWHSLPDLLSDFADIYTIDLPGFGRSQSIETYTEASLLAWMDEHLPETCYLIGLSLGGMLCRSFAAKFPHRVLGLVTLSTNLKFVADSHYPTAMPSSDFKLFSALWDQDKEACLKRFCALQAQGDKQQRQLTRQLRTINIAINSIAGRDMLGLLASIDGTQQVNKIRCPSLCIFGAKDCLVPVNASELLPNSHEIFVLDSASHLPHLSNQAEVVEKICAFIERPKYQLNKQQVAQSFGRAAKTYDKAAHIQKWSGEHLLNSLETAKKIESIVDLGCGTGIQAHLLQKKFPLSQVTGVDFSPQMLAYAESKQKDSSIKWVCADVENLALEDQSEDLVFSNFALQWCNDLDKSLAEIYRVLNTGGQFYFAVPGPETLWELRKVWGEIDKGIHINRFLSATQWHKALSSAGFGQISLSNTKKIQYHPSVKELLWNLKTVGATNHNSGKTKQLTGKSQIKHLYKAYEQFETSQATYPVTWDIIFGSAVK